MSDQYPTCPLHMLLKPCNACKPPHLVETACGDLDRGEMVVRCECGKVRGASRPHAYVSPAPVTPKWGYQ